MIPSEEFRQRRKSRAIVTAIVLAGLVILIFALAIAKIRAGWTP
jgi:accessory gene regulator protein AgrB